MVVLVIDTQKLIVNDELYVLEQFEANVIKIIDAARSNDVEVVYVRHDEGSATELTKGTEGFEIYDKFKPLPGEKIFDKKVNSAFKDTGLLEYLQAKGEEVLIVVGLQTDYCLDATVKCGFEHGFQMIVPAYANTTEANGYMSARQSYEYYNEFMWPNRYALCESVGSTIERMRQFGRNDFTK